MQRDLSLCRGFGGGAPKKSKRRELAHLAEFLVAVFEKEIGRNGEKGGEVFADEGFDVGENGGGFEVGAAEGFGDDLVDDAELKEIFGVHFESGGGRAIFGGVFPEDGGAAFGGDD